MAGDPTPTTARRQVGARLREFRQASGLTAAEVKEALGFSASKVSRMESGARAVSVEDLEALLALYAVEPARAREVEELARLGRRRRDPWVDVATTEADFQGFQQSGFVDLERDASFVREFNCSVVPGLLQTEAYMRAMMVAAAPADEVLRERAIPLRLGRQRRLELKDRYSVIIDESAVLRMIGAPDVMADQIDAMLHRCATGAVDLRIIPLNLGYHPALNSSFVVLSMDQVAGPELVFVEGVAGFQTIDGDEAVARFERVWEQLRSCAEPPLQTRRILEVHRDRYRSASAITRVEPDPTMDRNR